MSSLCFDFSVVEAVGLVVQSIVFRKDDKKGLCLE